MKITSFVLVCLLTAVSCNRSGILRINGTVDNTIFDGTKAYIVGSSITNPKEDSAVIRNSRFTFSLPADSMAVKSISIPRKGNDGVQDLIFIVEPGTLDVRMSVKSHSTGTRLNGLLMEWKKENFLYDSIQNDLYYRAGTPGITRESYDSIMRTSAVVDSLYMSRSIETMNNNLSNGIGLFFFKFYYDHLPKAVKMNVLEKTGGSFLNADKQVFSRVMFDPEVPKDNLVLK